MTGITSTVTWRSTRPAAMPVCPSLQRRDERSNAYLPRFGGRQRVPD